MANGRFHRFLMCLAIFVMGSAAAWTAEKAPQPAEQAKPDVKPEVKPAVGELERASSAHMPLSPDLPSPSTFNGKRRQRRA